MILIPLTLCLSRCTGLKISNLIASEIVRNEDVAARASAIEKWVAVADICRCLHNYNAVLEITSSMNRSAIFRLKKTWLKVSKQVRAGAGAGRPRAGTAQGEGRRSQARQGPSSPVTGDQGPGPQTWCWDPWVSYLPPRSEDSELGSFCQLSSA